MGPPLCISTNPPKSADATQSMNMFALLLAVTTAKHVSQLTFYQYHVPAMDDRQPVGDTVAKYFFPAKRFIPQQFKSGHRTVSITSSPTYV